MNPYRSQAILLTFVVGASSEVCADDHGDEPSVLLQLAKPRVNNPKHVVPQESHTRLLDEDDLDHEQQVVSQKSHTSLLDEDDLDHNKQDLYHSMRVSPDPTTINTVGWNSATLVNVREMTQAGLEPQSMTDALNSLVSKARNRVHLPAGMRIGVPAGPWSPMHKELTPPSGDKRDYMSTKIYGWPCTQTCMEAGFDAGKCEQWDDGLTEFGTCNAATGKPWVLRDGFANPAAAGDSNTLIVMADTVEALTLAWWFSPPTDETLYFATQAAAVLRAWFLNEDTRMNPNALYADGIPGYQDGTAGGLIAFTHRLDSRIGDCVELLRTGGSDIWSDNDNQVWQQWLADWYHWLRTSEFGQVNLRFENNHATFLAIHRIALAAHTNDDAAVLEEVKQLQTGAAGSLDKQIRVSGEMPLETARVTSLTYSSMNVYGLFKLGLLVENACQGLECVREPAKWTEFPNQISYCRYRGRGSTDSVEQCKASCLDHATCNGIIVRFKHEAMAECVLKECAGDDHELRDPTDMQAENGNWTTYMLEAAKPAWDWNWATAGKPSSWTTFADMSSACRFRGHGDKTSLEQCLSSCENHDLCNGVLMREKNGNLMDCVFKGCAGTDYQLSEQAPSGGNVWTVYMHTAAQAAGAGSVRQALDFLLQYAEGQKNWADDFPHSSDADKSWNKLAIPLRIAANKYENEVYESLISEVDPDGTGLGIYALLIPRETELSI